MIFKNNILLIVSMLLVCFNTYATTIYVSPDGSSSNGGTSYTDAIDILTALSQADLGDIILLQAGTYYISYTEDEKNTITFAEAGTSSSYITMEGDDGKAVIDFQFPEGDWVQDSYGFYVTGDYYYFKNITITHAGYQGAYVTGSHNTFDNCIFYDNRNSGLEINKGGEYTTVLNCDSYYNYDPKKYGSMADGFAPKQTQGPGNTFIGCRSWENSDDGFDFYDSPEAVILKNCWTFDNGIDVWDIGSDFAGNGNGFKVGGNGALGNHELYNCVAFGNPSKGFDQNNNTGGVIIYNCTGYDNDAYNFAFGGDLESGEENTFKNNLSYSGTVNYDNATSEYNSWDLGISMSSSDFESLDESYATVERNADGSLPYVPFLVPTASSDAIDAGTDVGLDYVGDAPDLGYYEVGSNVSYTLTVNQPDGGTISPSTGDYSENASVTVEAEAEQGYVFDYWTGSLSGDENPTTITMDDDKTIGAVFREAEVFDITVIVSGMGVVTPDVSGDQYEQTEINLTAIEYIGTTFSGWSGTYTSTDKDLSFTVDRDVSLTATFTATSDSTTYEFEDGYYVSDTAVFENSNPGYSGTGYVNTENSSGTWTEITVYAPTDGEYTAVIYYAATSDRPATISVDGTDVATLSETNTGAWTTWTGQTFTLTLSAGANTIRLTATGTEGAPNLDKIVFISNINTYTLIVNQVDGGTISPSSGDYAEGAVVEFTATADEGYVFSNWTDDLSGSDNPASLTIDAAKTVSAVFTELPRYTVTVTAESGGYITTHVNGTYYEGTELTFSAEAYVGYTFSSWTGDYVSTEADATVTVDTTKSIVANFEKTDTATTLEIEDGYYESGIADFENTNTGYSGTGYVNTENAADTWTEITVYAEAGEYSCELYYSATSDRPISILVDSVEQVTDLDMPATDSWTDWVTVTFTLTLSEGANTIRFVATGDEGAPNLDKIALQAVVDTVSQELVLSEGWNLVSVYVTADNMSIATIFPNATEVKTLSEYYYTNQADYFNTFTEIEAGTGYLVYNTVAETIEITGVELSTFNFQFSIQEGLNLVGCPYSETTSFEDAFDTEIDSIQLIENFEGYRISDGTQTIDSFEPGNAYFIIKN